MRVFFNFRSARITEPEHLRYLVESFTGCVINRSTDDLIIAKRAHQNRHGVSAADDEGEVRTNGNILTPTLSLRERWSLLPDGEKVRMRGFLRKKKRRKQMTFEMVDREIRF